MTQDKKPTYRTRTSTNFAEAPASTGGFSVANIQPKKQWFIIGGVVLVVLIAIVVACVMPHRVGDVASYTNDSKVSVQTDKSGATEQINWKVKGDKDITIEVSKPMVLKTSDGTLEMKFANSENSNGNIRFSLIQNGTEISSSGVIKPGFNIPVRDVENLTTGKATLKVILLDDVGNDTSSNMDIDVTIEESTE